MLNKLNKMNNFTKLIASYLVKPKMKLLDWIDLDKLVMNYLSKNPNANHILEQNKDKINWVLLSRNPNAIHLIEQNMDKIVNETKCDSFIRTKYR